jgi:transposase-like protein
MRRVPPSVIVREELDRLLAEGADQETNIVSALVDTVTRLVVQQLLEAEQADYLGGRGRYERRASDQVGSRNGYESGRLRTAEGAIGVRVPPGARFGRALPLGADELPRGQLRGPRSFGD